MDGGWATTIWELYLWLGMEDNVYGIVMPLYVVGLHSS